MPLEPVVRRYVTAATARALKAGGHVESTATDLRTFNIATLEWTAWITVPDEDPRVDTWERVRDGLPPL